MNQKLLDKEREQIKELMGKADYTIINYRNEKTEEWGIGLCIFDKKHKLKQRVVLRSHTLIDGSWVDYDMFDYGKIGLPVG